MRVGEERAPFSVTVTHAALGALVGAAWAGGAGGTGLGPGREASALALAAALPRALGLFLSGAGACRGDPGHCPEV